MKVNWRNVKGFTKISSKSTLLVVLVLFVLIVSIDLWMRYSESMTITIHEARVLNISCKNGRIEVVLLGTGTASFGIKEFYLEVCIDSCQNIEGEWSSQIVKPGETNIWVSKYIYNPGNHTVWLFGSAPIENQFEKVTVEC